MHGLGPIPTEENEPYFHHEWERRVFPLFASLFVGGHFNVDEFRHAIERMEPTEYLQSSYYEHWLHAFETLLLAKGAITVEELWGGASLPLQAWHTCADAGDGVDGCQHRRVCSVSHDVAPASGWAIGYERKISTRPPIPACRYARDKVGRIEIAHGVFITPDTAAHGLGEHPQHVYSVSFTAQALWGEPRPDKVFIDLWDDYLEEA